VPPLTPLATSLSLETYVAANKVCVGLLKRNFSLFITRLKGGVVADLVLSAPEFLKQLAAGGLKVETNRYFMLLFFKHIGRGGLDPALCISV